MVRARASVRGRGRGRGSVTEHGGEGRAARGDPIVEEQRRLLKEAPRQTHAVDSLFKEVVVKDVEPEEQALAVGPLRFRELTPPPVEEEVAVGSTNGAPRSGKIRAADMTPSRMEQIVSSLGAE